MARRHICIDEADNGFIVSMNHDPNSEESRVDVTVCTTLLEVESTIEAFLYPPTTTGGSHASVQRRN